MAIRFRGTDSDLELFYAKLIFNIKLSGFRPIINIETLVQNRVTSLLDELKKNGKKVTKGEICPHIVDQPPVFNATNLVEILTIVQNDTPLKSRRFYQYLKCFQDRVYSWSYNNIFVYLT